MSTISDLQLAMGRIDAEIAEAESGLETLRLERKGAEALLSRLTRETGEPMRKVLVPYTEQTRRMLNAQAPNGGNAQFVADILLTDSTGLSLQAIEVKAAERGQPLSNEQVRSAVTYLRKRGQAESVARGIWRLVASSDAEGPVSETGPSVTDTPTPAEGGEGREAVHQNHSQVPRWDDDHGRDSAVAAPRFV